MRSIYDADDAKDPGKREARVLKHRVGGVGTRNEGAAGLRQAKERPVRAAIEYGKEKHQYNLCGEGDLTPQDASLRGRGAEVGDVSGAAPLSHAMPESQS